MQYCVYSNSSPTSSSSGSARQRSLRFDDMDSSPRFSNNRSDRSWLDSDDDEPTMNSPAPAANMAPKNLFDVMASALACSRNS